MQASEDQQIDIKASSIWLSKIKTRQNLKDAIAIFRKDIYFFDILSLENIGESVDHLHKHKEALKGIHIPLCNR